MFNMMYAIFFMYCLVGIAFGFVVVNPSGKSVVDVPLFIIIIIFWPVIALLWLVLIFMEMFRRG